MFYNSKKCLQHKKKKESFRIFIKNFVFFFFPIIWIWMKWINVIFLLEYIRPWLAKSCNSEFYPLSVFRCGKHSVLFNKAKNRMIIRFRCYKFKTEQCHFSCKARVLKTDDWRNPVFWSLENWKMIPNPNAREHICQSHNENPEPVAEETGVCPITPEIWREFDTPLSILSEKYTTKKD